MFANGIKFQDRDSVILYVTSHTKNSRFHKSTTSAELSQYTLKPTESRRRCGRIWKERRCEGKIESWGERWEMRGTERETGRYTVTKWKGGARTWEQSVKRRTAEAGWLLTSQLHAVYVSMCTGMFCVWARVGAIMLCVMSGAREGLSPTSVSPWR